MNPGSRILIVDDNDGFRETLASTLRSAGYLVSEAADGEDALVSLTRILPSMAIVDLDMPKLNGLEFARQVKKVIPEFPVVLVTGYAHLYSPAELLSVGIDSFLEKPVPMEKLLDVIQRI
jgi:CheY-like chemotaxis protein